MVKENWIDFLRTGELKHFPFGMEKENLIEMLGEADDEIENSESAMLKYDKTEFYFYKGAKESARLDGILIQAVATADYRGNLDMDYTWLNKNLDYAKIKKLLVKESVPFEEVLSGHKGDEKVLKTGGEVVFYFSQKGKKINRVGRFMTITEFEELD